MKRAFAALIALLCALSLSALAEDTAAQDAAPDMPPEELVSFPEATVEQVSCSIIGGGGYYQVYCFAQVHNPTDEVLSLSWGTLRLQNGDETIAIEDVSQVWPHFLDPGADGYLFDIVYYLPETLDAGAPTITGVEYDVSYMVNDSQFGAVELACEPRIENDPLTGRTNVICEVANASGQDVYGPTVAFGLYTDTGVLLYADGTTAPQTGIPEGGTMLVRFEVDEELVEQWRSYGVSPAQVKAIATYRNEMD